MPVTNRPVALCLPPLKAPVLNIQPSTTPALQNLEKKFDVLMQQIRSEPASFFRESTHPMDYSAMRACGFFQKHNDYIVTNSDEDVFIHARREPAHLAGSFEGDKFHLSVHKEDVPHAFNALSDLLFSEDCPFDKWKVTDMTRLASGHRVSEGAQFTCYAKPGTEDSCYTAEGLHRIRCFMDQLEATLIDHDIRPGQQPESDVRPPFWQYTSYRNELRSQREGNENQSEALRNEPFYRLITESLPIQ
jgi:phosphothreonine lyase